MGLAKWQSINGCDWALQHIFQSAHGDKMQSYSPTAVQQFYRLVTIGFAGRRGRRPLHAGRGLLQFCGVQRRKALQIILLLFTTLKTTPNPISPERRNAARSTTIIHYSLLFILLPTSNS